MAQPFPFTQTVDPATMAEQVMRFSPASDSEALKFLRARFPDCPLSVRVAALDYLMRHRKGEAGAYSPR